MPQNVAPQVQYKTVSEVRTISASFAGKLDSGEVLIGTPTVAEVTTSDLTIASPTVSSSALTIDGESVAAALAVTALVSGGTAGTTYKIRITSTTTSTPAQTVILTITLVVVAD